MRYVLFLLFTAFISISLPLSEAPWDLLWRVSIFSRWNIDEPQCLKDKTSHCVLKLDCQLKLFMNVPQTYDPLHACAHRPDWQWDLGMWVFSSSKFQSSRPRNAELLLFILLHSVSDRQKYAWSHDLVLELCMLPETQEPPRPTLPLIGPYCTSHLLVNDRKMSLSKVMRYLLHFSAILEFRLF